jgi:hypothetical protein
MCPMLKQPNSYVTSADGFESRADVDTRAVACRRHKGAPDERPHAPAGGAPVRGA